MKETKLIKRKGERGITLIALVVTIVVLLILAGITITFVLSDGGILQKAREAADKTNNVIANEQGDMDKLAGDIENFVGGRSSETKEPISKTDPFVGYYVKIDGEYGIIYADLAIGNTKSGQWNSEDGAYSISKEENIETLKDYYIVEKSYQAKGFEARPVLAVINSEGESKKDRFHVMALEDIDKQVNGTKYCWYDAAEENEIEGYETLTSENFGEGWKNTDTMIKKWSADPPEYGNRDDNEEGYKDIWGAVKGKFAKGWFVPSRAEWSAFGEELGINLENSSEKNLSDGYWSSSLSENRNGWFVKFGENYIRL